MKARIFTRGQTWRCIALAAQLLALIVMAIPGSYVWCGIEEIYYDASYLHPDPYVFIWFWMAYGLAVLVGLLCLTTFLRKRSGLILLLLTIACGVVLLWIEYTIPLRMAVQALGDGNAVWLPFVPPVLLILSLTAAVVAWFVGRKEA